jgi:chaperone BCS1
VLLHKDRQKVESITGGLAYHETLTFATLSRAAVQDMILEARSLAFPEDDLDIEVMIAEGWHWSSAGKRPVRPPDSVILQNHIAEDLTADAQRFVENRTWYRSHAIPYQRGYLLHGPPGNGKTSTVLVMAGLLGRDLYILRASSVSDDSFSALLMRLPEQAVLLIEDVDCVFTKREPGEKAGNKYDEAKLTFSAFLNGLDGATAPEGRILFMTTNHPEVLDPALLRPGRIDRQFHLGNATPEQAIRLFQRFFPDAPATQAKEFGKAVQESPVELSMAQLQEHILSHSDNPIAAMRLS